MQRKFRSFEDAFTASPASAVPVAANDNKPARRAATRYRGNLPALRWLFAHDVDLARALAAALPQADTTWSADACDSRQEIRPTPGELIGAATESVEDLPDGTQKRIWHEPVVEQDHNGHECIRLGQLNFVRGELVEYGRTKKGSKLRPRDRLVSRDGGKQDRNPSRYLKTRPTTPSPLHATWLPRAVSAEPALPPMYDPQEGVEANRATLAAAYENSPHATVTRCPTVVAKGAIFLGGVSHPCGNASKSAPLMWEGPGERKGEARIVIEEVAARGTLKSIGERLGFSGEMADRKGREALLNAARVFVAANDNEVRKKSAA